MADDEEIVCGLVRCHSDTEYVEGEDEPPCFQGYPIQSEPASIATASGHSIHYGLTPST